MLHWGSFMYDVWNLQKEGNSGVAAGVVNLLTGPVDDNPYNATGKRGGWWLML